MRVTDDREYSDASVRQTVSLTHLTRGRSMGVRSWEIYGIAVGVRSWPEAVTASGPVDRIRALHESPRAVTGIAQVKAECRRDQSEGITRRKKSGRRLIAGRSMYASLKGWGLAMELGDVAALVRRYGTALTAARDEPGSPRPIRSQRTGGMGCLTAAVHWRRVSKLA
jgi:hypothetical protein